MKTDGAESAAEAAVKKCWQEGEPRDLITETDGIILKQTRLPDDRRMLVLFTRKFGKISAGTSIRLNGENKSSLALRVFTHGRYELFFGGKSCNVNAAETLNSYFKIGEDIDKYMLASYILEFTDRLIMENQPNEKLFELLVEFLRLLERRRSKTGISDSDLSVESSGHLRIYARSGRLRQMRSSGHAASREFLGGRRRTDL